MLGCLSNEWTIRRSNEEEIQVRMTPTLPLLSNQTMQVFARVRQQSLDLCAPLTPEDMMVQSCEEASPAKWHLAHTTWFFETFILREFLPSYRAFHPDFLWLFNSYYNSLSDQPDKKLRGVFSRPGIESIFEYRRYVEEHMARLEEQGMEEEAERRLVLGVHHEQQHQELLCYDIKNAFWSNPLLPAYKEDASSGKTSTQPEVAPNRWLSFEGGIHEIGHAGGGFSYDNEGPRHREFLEPFTLASRLVTCGEYLAFMEDGGYRRPELWLSDGWNAVHEQRWQAPLYWRMVDGAWCVYTLGGMVPLDTMMNTPACHISFLEADAFAHWAGRRLPTEAEWEVAAAGVPIEGNFLESGPLHPVPAESATDEQAPNLTQMFGDVWEWTRSPYVGYPGYKAVPGALGEYNGKFMSSQMVLRGGSAVTPLSHIRSTYRNFFSPSARWQFAGIRLAGEPLS
jgi:ergothioneine biosynthesis protein EgtB